MNFRIFIHFECLLQINPQFAHQAIFFSVLLSLLIPLFFQKYL